MRWRLRLVFHVGWSIPAAAPTQARARSGQLVWRDRRGRGGTDRWAHPSGHFSASQRLGRARYYGDVDNGRRDDDNSDAGDDVDYDDGAA
eukprot:3041123-Pyramimonas_sp.AAC.1